MTLSRFSRFQPGSDAMQGQMKQGDDVFAWSTTWWGILTTRTRMLICFICVHDPMQSEKILTNYGDTGKADSIWYAAHIDFWISWKKITNSKPILLEHSWAPEFNKLKEILSNLSWINNYMNSLFDMYRSQIGCGRRLTWNKILKLPAASKAQLLAAVMLYSQLERQNPVPVF